MLGRFAEARLAGMSDAELAEFETLLALPDPDLQGWLLTGEDYKGSALSPLLDRIRAFNGLASGARTP